MSFANKNPHARGQPLCILVPAQCRCPVQHCGSFLAWANPCHISSAASEQACLARGHRLRSQRMAVPRPPRLRTGSPTAAALPAAWPASGAVRRLPPRQAHGTTPCWARNGAQPQCAHSDTPCRPCTNRGWTNGKAPSCRRCQSPATLGSRGRTCSRCPDSGGGRSCSRASFWQGPGGSAVPASSAQKGTRCPGRNGSSCGRCRASSYGTGRGSAAKTWAAHRRHPQWSPARNASCRGAASCSRDHGSVRAPLCLGSGIG
mmetsp:Transcript_62808/g.202597  ORF Transcript_62808/g.202597 Transcript_62808/m.202597 type:complete len:260 (+) Transcript_62808:110-889(+)